MFRFYARMFLVISPFLPVVTQVYADPDIHFFEKIEIIQRMDWPAADDVLNYELVIEKKNETPSGDGFTQILDMKTETNSAELSLPPGEYRYRIIVYDLLGRSGPVPGWARLTIFPALKPEILSVKPSSVSVQDALSGVTLHVLGNNLAENAEIIFSAVEGGEGGMEQILLDRDSYRPDKDGKNARLILDGLALKEGAYNIVIKNPGGISSVWRNFTVTDSPRVETPVPDKKSTFETTSAAGYAPLFPVSGDFNSLVDNIPFYVGAMLRLGISTKNKPYGIFGVETEAYWHRLSGDNGSFTVSGHLINIQLNLLYQKRIFREKAAVNVRLGGGFAYIVDMQLRNNTDVFLLNAEILMPMAAVSMSFTWFFIPPLFLELGAGYAHVFSSDASQSAYIRPFCCLGFKI